uniref:Glutamate receptor n=1 Tax=Macrostomum lignano TaxID=282301 RepID=A0A1I8I359_9PLAT
LPKFSGVMGGVNFAGTLRNTDSTFAVTQLQFNSAGVASSAKVGTWTRAGGLAGDVSSVELTYLTKRTLNVRLIHDPPFVIKLPNGTFTGYSVEMLQGIAERMNFDYRLVEQPDGAYGVMLANGSWNGMMGALERGSSTQFNPGFPTRCQDADMAIGPITITAQREQVADFSVPIYDYVSLQIVLKKAAASNDQTFFLKAFTWDVWVCIIAIVTVTGFLIFFVDKVSPFSFQNRYRNDQVRDGEAEGKVFTVKESLWYVLGAYTQAGESFDPRSMSCRTIIVGFWLFGYLMMSLYTANLAAQLTVDKLVQPPQGFDELTTQATVKYTVIKDTAAYEHFQRMMNAEKNLYRYWLTSGIGNEETVNEVAALETWKYPVIERYTSVWSRMTRWGFADSTEDALKKIRQDGMAVFLDSALVKYYSAQSCDLMTVGEPFAPRPYGVALRQKSPLLKALNI